jgi:hypothetical protein
LFTAAQTELGKSEEWFWNVTPRIMTTMLDEKKKIDLEKMKLIAYLNNGGKLEDTSVDDTTVPSDYDPFEDL